MPGLTITQFRSKKQEFIGKMILVEAVDDLGHIKFRGEIESIDPAHFTGFVIILDKSEAKRDNEADFSRCNKISLVLKMPGWSKFWQDEDGTIIFLKNISDYTPGFDYKKIIIHP